MKISFMFGTRYGDPLTVWTAMVAGEEVAFSDPDVSDARRAAAGRETAAERTRGLLAGNRERAAASYAAGALPKGQEMLRVWRARDPADLRVRLGTGNGGTGRGGTGGGGTGRGGTGGGGTGYAAVWAEGDVLHVLWQGGGERVLLGGGVSVPMWPVEGAGGLWEASLRVRGLDEAVLTLFVTALDAADTPFGRRMTDRLSYRGPRAPQDGAEERTLAGDVTEHVLRSAPLRADRTVSVYVPPTGLRTGPLPGCVLADGEATRSFAQVLEAAIESGDAPPVLVVGVHNAGAEDAAERSDLRSQEYLPGYKPRRFAAHLSFVTGEVIPWAAKRFPVADGPWISAGFSSGAAWAIAAAQRRPDVFGGVAGLSAGVVPKRVAGASRGVRHYLAAGTLEEGFRRQTREWAERLRRAGVPCLHREWVGGHDPFWWEHSLPEALA